MEKTKDARGVFDKSLYHGHEVKDIITQDRQATATALLTALEKEKEWFIKRIKELDVSEEVIEGMDIYKTYTHAQTIVKELLTPTV